MNLLTCLTNLIYHLCKDQQWTFSSTADANPVCVHNARPIPFAFPEQVKQQLDDMTAYGIIEPVTEPSEWCHPIVIVPKKGTSEVRLTVDFKKLNDQIQQPVQSVQTPCDVVSTITGVCFLMKLDARHGCWQNTAQRAGPPCHYVFYHPVGSISLFT